MADESLYISRHRSTVCIDNQALAVIVHKYTVLITDGSSCLLREFFAIPINDLGILQRKFVVDPLDDIFGHCLQSLLHTGF